MSRETHVRFCERLGVQLPGSTHLSIATSNVAFLGKTGARASEVVSKLQVNLWSAPVLQPLTLDAVLACTNLSGVVVGTAPRASMKFAPTVPIELCGFRSLFTCRGVPQAGVRFTSSGFSRRKSREG
jgi:hypothetical protein